VVFAGSVFNAGSLTLPQYLNFVIALIQVRHKVATGDCESEIELNPNSYLVWAGRGHVYKVTAPPEEALRSFERAMRMSPMDARLHFAFGGDGAGLY
jgi:adenylate cyclase